MIGVTVKKVLRLIDAEMRGQNAPRSRRAAARDPLHRSQPEDFRQVSLAQDLRSNAVERIRQYVMMAMFH